VGTSVRDPKPRRTPEILSGNLFVKLLDLSKFIEDGDSVGVAGSPFAFYNRSMNGFEGSAEVGLGFPVYHHLDEHGVANGGFPALAVFVDDAVGGSERDFVNIHAIRFE